MVHLRNSHAMIRDGYDSPGPSGDGLTARWRAGETGWCCRGSGATHSPCVPCKHHHPANAGAADMRPPWRWRRAMPPARAGRRRRRRGSAGAAGAFPEAGRFAAVRTVAKYWSNSGQTAIENWSGRGRAVVKMRSKSGQTAAKHWFPETAPHKRRHNRRGEKISRSLRSICSAAEVAPASLLTCRRQAGPKRFSAAGRPSRLSKALTS